jgi:hypothetical protein
MAEGKRPGGLTALAVLNFVFGGLGALVVLGLIALLSVAESVANEAGTSISSAPGAGMVYVAILLSVVSTVLMIASGVGYLKQRRFLGRTLGNAYAAFSIGSSVFAIVALSAGVGIGTIIGLIYPVLTLVLLNTTFKDDLVY